MRTPLYPVERLAEIETEKDSDIFRESLYVASPEFAERLRTGQGGRDDDKRELSIYKYYSRACTRCTPFGLFAGCSTGEIGEETGIRLEPVEKYTRTTRLDMQYLCALIRHIETIPEIRKELLFYPNDSIYELAGKLRYIEYYYIKTKRHHQVAEVESSEYITAVLDRARNGATVQQLAAVLVTDDISPGEAEEFIGEMIGSHLLKSELDPAVVGGDVLETLIDKLSRFHTEGEVLGILKQISAKLLEIDSNPIGTTTGIYGQIIELIKKTGIEYEPKFLFQTDMFKPAPGATVSTGVIEDIEEFLELLVDIGRQFRHPNLTAFQKEFTERYGDRTIPLEIVLDNEAGLGYPYEEGAAKNVNPLIDDLVLPSRAADGNSIPFGQLDPMLLRKYARCIKEGGNTLLLTDNDFKIKEKRSTDRENLPATLSVMCRLVKDSADGRLIHFKGANGISATALLGRFHHLDRNIARIIQTVADKEKELQPDDLLAEISHLPESRIGNIASRPLFRDYVIHYLSNSDAQEQCNIPLSDLLLSVRQGKLCLTSKRYGKRVVPKLSCAHNHSLSPIPLYRFLCDMEAQELKYTMGLSYGEVFSHFDYLPRLQYKNILLSRQRWRIRKEDIEEAHKLPDSEPVSFFSTLSERLGLKRRLLIGDSDNELCVDTRNITSLRTMFNHVKKRDAFFVEEFLFDDKNSPVNASGSSFNNEIIFFFHK